MKARTLKMFFAVLLSMLPSVWVMGQAYMVNDMPSLNSIVRMTDEGTAILYNQTSSSQGCFVFHTTSYTRSFDLPASMLVNDFVIGDNNTAWFCGSMNDFPVVGYFPIPIATSTGCPVTFSVINVDTSLNKVNSFDRMDFRRIGSNRITLAIVGSVKANGNGMIIYPAVMAADLISGSQWRIWCKYDTLLSIRYTDIVALDSMFVAVGTDASGNGCFMESFSFAPDFVCHECSRDTITLLRSDKITEGEVLVARTGTRSVSIVQHVLGKQSLVHHRVNFQRICEVSGVESFEYSDVVPQPAGYDTTDMRLLELRYGASLGYPYLLHRGFHPQSQSEPFSLSPWLIPMKDVPVKVFSLDMDDCRSLDIQPSTGCPVTSGKNNGFSFLDAFFHPLEGKGACRRASEVKVKVSGISLKRVPIGLRLWDDRFDFGDLSPMLESEKLVIICK